MPLLTTDLTAGMPQLGLLFGLSRVGARRSENREPDSYLLVTPGASLNIVLCLCPNPATRRSLEDPPLGSEGFILDAFTSITVPAASFRTVSL